MSESQVSAPDASTHTETTAGTTEPLVRKSWLPTVLLVIVCVALAGWLGWKTWWGWSHVSSDNAQIEGHIVPILPRVGGYIVTLDIKDHQMVKAGDLLAQIDDRDYRLKLVQAEAELALAMASAGKSGVGAVSREPGQAEAQMAAARATAAGARSNIDQALANADKAQKDLERMRLLVAQKMASPQALDAAEAAARAAQALVRASRNNATSANEQATASSAALRAAIAHMQAARAARDFAANQLADTRILAPTGGMVTNRSVELGQLVQPGQPLLAIVPLDDVWIMANLKETDLGRVRVGAAVQVEVDAYPDLKLDGQVESLSPATGARFSLLPPDNATGNFTKVVQRVPARIHIQQNTDASRPLRPGMSVLVVISASQ